MDLGLDLGKYAVHIQEIIMFDSMQITKGNVRVEWVNLDEGFSGYYDPEDPDDINFLRFDVSVLDGGEWVDPGDASYCTQFPADAPLELQVRALSFIMDEVYNLVQAGIPIKKTCERLSWISPDWVKHAE